MNRRILISVDLPAPLALIKPTAPRSALNKSESSAVTEPKRRERWDVVFTDAGRTSQQSQLALFVELPSDGPLIVDHLDFGGILGSILRST